MSGARADNHVFLDAVRIKSATPNNNGASYQFFLHEHPYVSELIEALNAGSVADLQRQDTKDPPLREKLFTLSSYDPTNLVIDDTPDHPYPVKNLDFNTKGAYSVYNWELFYHIPLTIAIHLSKNQRFEEAYQWFRYVFDPTDDSDGPTPDRFFQVLPLRTTPVIVLEKLLRDLHSGNDQDGTVTSISHWRGNPFQPFVIARDRVTPFMLKAVAAFLDNCIACGDSLFAQYQPETIREAAQWYTLAANILGPKPQAVPKKGSVEPTTYAALRSTFDPLDNALVNIETDIPFDVTPPPNGKPQNGALDSLALYFCVPRNDRLLEYWDTVADRLFKIHNSLNIQGVFEQVPLWAPPIDPALLVRAAAAGLDVAAIVNGLNQPLPLVRFQYLVQRALEICQEVKTLGANVLAAIEKQDNEAYSILRARHETTILGLGESVKYAGMQEAMKNREGLQQSIANTFARYTYYEKLLNRQDPIVPPVVPDLDKATLMSEAFASSEPVVIPRTLAYDIVQDVLGIAGGRIISSHESFELVALELARFLQDQAGAGELLASGLSLIPQFEGDVKPIGVGAGTGFGGVQLSKMVSMMAGSVRLTADEISYRASQAARIGGFARREQEWAYQSNIAAGELNQLIKQLRAAQIREAIAEREWSNHQKQIEQATEVESFLTDETFQTDGISGKTTNQAFYVWMKREVKALYAQSFQLAADVARKAELALQQELGDPTRSFIQVGYLAGKEGLLAGEKLFQDLKRMEIAYLDLNRREYEFTKHISLLQLDPIALLRLRSTGSCTITIPEEVFDFDWPAYFRRIKSVAISIPCVVGPYTSLNCRLTLVKSSIRKSTDTQPEYPRDGDDVDRFSDFSGSVQAIVTSTGVDDSGMFEVNLHDERKLPFEYFGAVSQWQLDLSSAIPQFDFNTISDVILHMRYTAREAGEQFRTAATKNLKLRINAAQANGSVRLFSIRHEFPTEWARFASAAITGKAWAPLALTLRPEHYPFWATSGATQLLKGILAAHVFALFTNTKASPIQVSDAANGDPHDVLVHDASFGGSSGTLGPAVKLPQPTGPWTPYFDNNSMDDLYIALAWGTP